MRTFSLVLGLCIAAAPCLAQMPQSLVDARFEELKAASARAEVSEIVEIDHARLAAQEGVAMPPARLRLISDPAVNAAILAQSVRAGLDLPFRTLSYWNGDAALVIATSAEFLARRHGITDQDALARFDAGLAKATSPVDITPAPTTGLIRDYGIVELVSVHDVATTAARIKETVMAQGDTIWFGEVDLAAESAGENVSIAPAVLLLFGGPEPRGIAMAEFPAIGLDAFCQKLLVYQGQDGEVRVIFNDISAMAKLHYQTSAPPHAALNARLTETFASAIR